MKLNATNWNNFEQLGRHLELVVGAFYPTENFGLNFQEWNTFHNFRGKQEERTTT